MRFAAPRGPDGWSARGIDEAEFYISPNPGEDLRPLARIASGGELSRLMLALKTLASTDAPGKTLIFDEVDAASAAPWPTSSARGCGIGGGVPGVVHHTSSADRGYGGTHYRIEKALKSGRTVTSVTRLGVREREDELARMIAGLGSLRIGVRASAREMLKRKGAQRLDQSAGDDSLTYRGPESVVRGRGFGPSYRQ